MSNKKTIKKLLNRVLRAALRSVVATIAYCFTKREGICIMKKNELGVRMMELKRIELDFTVCKIEDITGVDFGREFVFLAKTDEELSLVCETDCVPGNVLIAEDGWKALKIIGMLDFGMVGVIAEISRHLAAAGISLFVVSTYNTDYILLKADSYEAGIEVLRKHDYIIR